MYIQHRAASTLRRRGRLNSNVRLQKMPLSSATTSNCIQLPFWVEARRHGLRCGTSSYRHFVVSHASVSSVGKPASMVASEAHTNLSAAMPQFSQEVCAPKNRQAVVCCSVVLEVIQSVEAAGPTSGLSFDHQGMARRRTRTHGRGSGSNAVAVQPLCISISRPWLKPNPSLKGSANGMRPWPRGAHIHSTPRGQGCMPSSPP